MLENKWTQSWESSQDDNKKLDTFPYEVCTKFFMKARLEVNMLVS